jgi:hypothetical protein
MYVLGTCICMVYAQLGEACNGMQLHGWQERLHVYMHNYR